MIVAFDFSTLIVSVLVALSCVASCVASSDGAILVLGDSWASASGSFLTNVCTLGENTNDGNVPRALTNNGKAGSTAKQWASENLAVKPFYNAKYDYQYVWLSIGGNDFNCDESKHDEIAIHILDVITDIFASSSNEDIRVLFTGYGYPSSALCGDDTLTTVLFDSLSWKIRNKISESAYADKVHTMDISSLYVTDKSYPLSDKTWYADSIHINEAGYVKLFSMDTIQAFFGCITSTDSPSPRPTNKVTEAPSIRPSVARSSAPSPNPSAKVTEIPSIRPSVTRSSVPSPNPSAKVTEIPSIWPSVTRTNAPSLKLLAAPTNIPTFVSSSGTGETATDKPSESSSKDINTPINMTSSSTTNQTDVPIFEPSSFYSDEEIPNSCSTIHVVSPKLTLFGLSLLSLCF